MKPFYGTDHGRFAGITVIRQMPKLLYKVLSLSVVDSVDKTVEALNAFQPDVISSYGGSLAALSKAATRGDLRVSPSAITFGGEPLRQRRSVQR